MKRLIDAVELTKTLEEILAEPDHDKIETRAKEAEMMTLDEAHTRAVHNDRLFKVNVVFCTKGENT